jgi:hypothetical protein
MADPFFVVTYTDPNSHRLLEAWRLQAQDAAEAEATVLRYEPQARLLRVEPDWFVRTPFCTEGCGTGSDPHDLHTAKCEAEAEADYLERHLL